VVYGLNPLLMCFPHCQAGSLSLVSLEKPPRNFKTITKPLQILKHTLQLHIWKQYVCHLQAISILQWESCSLISYNELKSYCDILVSRVNLESVLRKFCILTVNLGTFSIKMDLTMSIPQGFVLEMKVTKIYLKLKNMLRLVLKLSYIYIYIYIYI